MREHWSEETSNPSKRQKVRPRERSAETLILVSFPNPRGAFSSAMARLYREAPYCTPDGQVVSKARQVRQRSRCRRVFAVGAAPSSICFQVDAAARAVELVAEQLVGRTGGVAEAAMHALAQDGVGLPALGRVANESCKLCLHGLAIRLAILSA